MENLRIFAIGQYDTEGDYQEYASSVELQRFGNTMRTDFGHCIAVLDECGDWVSPTLQQLGLKSVINIVTQTSVSREIPTCDLCHGIDVHDVCKDFYEEDTQVNYRVCPDCIDQTDARLIPVPSTEELEWN